MRPNSGKFTHVYHFMSENGCYKIWVINNLIDNNLQYTMYIIIASDKQKQSRRMSGRACCLKSMTLLDCSWAEARDQTDDATEIFLNDLITGLNRCMHTVYVT